MIAAVFASAFAGHGNIDASMVNNAMLTWAGRRMPDALTAEEWGKAKAIGVASFPEQKLLAVVVYHQYKELPFGNDIQISVAADDRRWLSRSILWDIFDYPFNQLRCRRVTTINGRSNKRARTLAVKTGFRLEGVARKGYDGKQDAMIYGMLREECRWLDQKVTHGQEKRAIPA